MHHEPLCIATLGPASFHLISELASTGVSGFRLNTSHMDLNQILQRLHDLRSLSDLPVVLDLQGAKMRLGVFDATAVSSGELLCFDLQGTGGIPLPHPEFFQQVNPGDTVSLDDNRLTLRVLRVEEQSAQLQTLTSAVIKPRKGVNIMEHPVRLGDLSSFDDAVCRSTRDFPGVELAVSFVESGNELQWIRKRANGTRVIAKIERREATQNLAAITERADEVWICRGDLGAQLGAAPMAKWINEYAPNGGRPVLMAGQVLEHLTRHQTPTRSEVCHVYDLIARGYSGIVLSDETAIGENPLLAARTAVELLNEF